MIVTLHQTWMTPDDQDVQQSQDIDAEVTRRINASPIEPTHLGSPDPVHDVQGIQLDDIDSINSDEELLQHNTKKRLTIEVKALGQIDESILTRSSRRKPISYAGMLG